MRGADVTQEALFTTLDLETFAPQTHPLGAAKAKSDETLWDCSPSL